MNRKSIYKAIIIIAVILIAYNKINPFNESKENAHLRLNLDSIKKYLPGIVDFFNVTDSYANKSVVYIITPTYRRNTQMADLIVLRNTLVLVPKIVWIVIEDSENKSERISDLLERSRIKHVHLVVPTPITMNGTVKLPQKLKGAYQRNIALSWLRLHKSILKSGVLYFADDDNRYDVRIFEDIRSTQRISVWPVGLVGGFFYEGPVCKNNTVIEFFTSYKRKFSIDMAGFAVNIEYFFKYPNAKFESPPGLLESRFLQQLNASMDTLEPKADCCTKVWVWHTRTSTTHYVHSVEKLKNEKNLTYNPIILETV